MHAARPQALRQRLRRQTELRVAQDPVGQPEVGVFKEVERFGTKLQRQLLPEMKIAAQCKIDLPRVQTANNVPCKIAYSTQYFSYPDYDFDLLRREALAQYEAYSDLVPKEWTHLRIEVSGSTARFYVGAAAQPVLIVRDLKGGLNAHGTLGLWVGSGTNGHFHNRPFAPR